MMRVHMTPVYTTPDQADGGIRRVVDALMTHLPAYDVTLTDDPDRADLLAVHGTMTPPRDDLPLVTHNHGLYWREYAWSGRWSDDANAACLLNLRKAQAITAPSLWVAQALRRGILTPVEVIHHGVDPTVWTPGTPGGYVLWNKARVDPVSDPAPVNAVAALLPHVPFITTFGTPAPNVHVLGALHYDAMRALVRNASVYLVTTRETFGIGTLEALACGVPVVGYAYGGQEEILTPETGVLVPPGDEMALARAIDAVLARRADMSAACRNDAVTRWTWPARVAQYADLYHRVLRAWRTPRPTISVVITAHNLNRYLADAIRSVLSQDLESLECIVIDDGGDERAEDVTRTFSDARLTVQRIVHSGLAEARNVGARLATGRYLLFLDADDMLAPGAARILSDALDRRSDLAIAAGGLAVLTPDGPQRNAWPDGVDYRAQLAHLNTLHYAALWRRDAFLRTGGYRARDWRAEDAALWIRAMSFGLHAEQVTDRPTLWYRMREDSKTRREHAQHADKDGDWTAWFGWRLGAANARAGMQLLQAGATIDAQLVPFAAPVVGSRRSWPISHAQEPRVSIIIPVGPGHAPYLVDALDSVLAQGISDYECLVVNDTGAPLDLTPWPWARVMATAGRTGAGAARNVGLAAARAPLVLFLDADDCLTATALTYLLAAYQMHNASYVYGGWIVAHPDARLADLIRIDATTLPAYRANDPAPAQYGAAPLYDQQRVLHAGYDDASPGLHSVTALIETAAARAVGGFDTELMAWEDWEFYLRLAAAGYCGVAIDAPTLIYRVHTGQRRRIGQQHKRALQRTLRQRYAGVTAMPCCGSDPATRARVTTRAPAPSAPDQHDPAGARNDTRVRLKYVGNLVGDFTVIGRPSGTSYRMGANPFSRYVDVLTEDVDWMLARGDVEVLT